MTPHVLTFSLSPDEFAARKAALAGQGVNIAGDSGDISHDGVKVAYAYNGTDTLTITVEHKPFVLPESTIEKDITAWFSKPV